MEKTGDIGPMIEKKSLTVDERVNHLIAISEERLGSSQNLLRKITKSRYRLTSDDRLEEVSADEKAESPPTPEAPIEIRLMYLEKVLNTISYVQNESHDEINCIMQEIGAKN